MKILAISMIIHLNEINAKCLNVFVGLVSKPTGQVEEAQEDDQRFPITRSPAAITRSASFRLHV